MNYEIRKRVDLLEYRRVLGVKNKHIKEFFNIDGCGLEIEFGVRYEARCRLYIKTGLAKLRDLVKGCGKIVLDDSIGSDLNIELVLDPMDKEALRLKFEKITAVLSHYENFVFNDNCGLHANFRAEDALKRRFYYALVNGAYEAGHFLHSKYKPDFMTIVKKPDRGFMSYDEYVSYQQDVSHKYVAVNFLKPHLIEVRSLGLNWDMIAYTIDLFEATAAAP